ncbi:ribbon-helix-helix domain-containing protein [Dissulfurispira sp.]|uniref:ribbon-helix-helix domain-containing protein n=1 Tax=Dissulfurispira sp. TaxID=2817609 RepID=UPI002FD942B0
MPATSALRKAKLTVTISGDVINEIDEIAKEKGNPRSQVMEEILRDWLLKSKKMAIEKDIEAYYISLTENEKKENREWSMIATESAKRTWND